jgi:hypothetical protein
VLFGGAAARYRTCRPTWFGAYTEHARSRPSPNDDPSLCATLQSVGGVGELYQRPSVIVTLCRPRPYQDRGRAGTAGNRFARDDKELGPQLGEAIPGERPREKTPRRDTRALGLAGMFGGKAPLRLAAKKSRPHEPLTSTSRVRNTHKFFALCEGLGNPTHAP